MKQLRVLIALVAMSAVLSACETTDASTESTSSVTEEVQIANPVGVSYIAINPDNLSINVGDTTTVELEVEGEALPASGLSYSTSDETVATVSQDGVITGIGHGATTLSVFTEDGLYTGTALIEVTDKTLVVEELF